MSNPGPEYIDQFSKGSRSSNHGDEAVIDIEGARTWVLGLRRRIPLWKAFWVYFVLGHGAIFGMACGITVLSLVAGNFFSPLATSSIARALSLGGGLIVIMYLVFAFWVVITVWRNSGNCYDRKYGIYANSAMVVYIITIVSPFLWYLVG